MLPTPMRPNATTHIPFQGDAEAAGDCEFYGAPKNASFITRPGYVRQKRYEILPPSNSVQLWNASRQAGSTKRLA